MRNELNSIIIEGTLITDAAECESPDGAPVCSFTIANERFYRRPSGIEKEVYFFEIEAHLGLAEAMKKRKRVRVAGRLKQAGSEGRTVIAADHIEFRPDLKEK